jgi:V/A-type H+-transporting ATPase subunit K
MKVQESLAMIRKRPALLLLIMLPTILMSITTAAVVASAVPNASAVPASQTSVTDLNPGLYGVGAGLAVGLAGIGAGAGIGISGAAAIAVLAEKPEAFFRAFIIVILADAVSIYGLVIAILLYIKI